MCISDLSKLMVEYGLVIRGIPHFHEYKVEVRHKERYLSKPEKYVEVNVYFDEVCKREMLRVKEKLSKGGKFIITQCKDQFAAIPNWGWGKPVVFYDSVIDAVANIVSTQQEAQKK